MFTLRLAKEEDLGIIRGLAEQTWPTAYSKIISQAQIDYMLLKMYNQGELLSQLLNGHQFLVVSSEAEDLGFAGFSLVDDKNGIYKLHKLYVLPKAHGMGLGRLLINEVIDRVMQKGGQVLVLNVNRENKSWTFYEKLGFKIKETVNLDIGNGFFMNDYLMQKEL